ncbi:hypothetical protein Pcac1_g9255 [Phytophthora cactorum]|uniref:Uncharacterized protein n=1 Tax=Phytophthora cactorum TaxID=29920 RepID=A0A8T1D2V0_9STRA|nr:hypothetical protein Pcac1_g9255 [Phytophthora cactorum]KAG2931222.1 hypothetical protein PC117_g13529 [Phytophthora cactorum]KAG2981826.1 hypothetical protein PC119_g20926 [Phytophthora cactorum]KAG3062206.1 hypothetical protein PC122_g19366 [Phytophthora cactorum]KAG3135993.1 hypothetical protein C6341_g21558 [Phytophthora cactorum]
MAAVVAATPQTLASPARASTTPARATLQGAKRVAITAQGVFCDLSRLGKGRVCVVGGAPLVSGPVSEGDLSGSSHALY